MNTRCWRQALRDKAEAKYEAAAELLKLEGDPGVDLLGRLALRRRRFDLTMEAALLEHEAETAPPR